MEMRRAGKFQEVVGHALAVAFHARWSEGAIFNARDCAKWCMWNIICSAHDFRASVGAVKTCLGAVN
jgi:hypothetical protein